MTMSAESSFTRCGYVAIVGRPNVGKSSLLNRILGQKISITSRKPQTTRHRVLGIKTAGQVQTIYVDTPGLHRDEKRAINRYMNRTALAAISDVDIIVVMTAGTALTVPDREVIAQLPSHIPAILVVNKVDTVPDKTLLLPVIDELARQGGFAHIVPMSARSGENVAKLESLVSSMLPPGPFLFPEDQVTDRSERFLVGELVREKLMRRLGQELPYATTVVIEEFFEKNAITHITALILVEGVNQRRIVIGAEGSMLKEVGKQARLDMEQVLGKKVFLRLWVKVREGWADDERSLQLLGYHDS